MRNNVKYFFSIFLLLIFILLFFLGLNAFYIFIFSYLCLFLIFPPKHLISPASVIFAYYGIWYIAAPAFASGYQGDVLLEGDYQLSFILLMVTMFFCIFGASAVEMKSTPFKPVLVRDSLNFGIYLFVLLILYCICTAMLALIVTNSGGFVYWLSNPGDAFLNRAGTGIYVIISHYFGFILAALSGYVAYHFKKNYVIYSYIFWLMATSFIHGSKFQIGLFIIVSLLPWLFFTKFISVRTCIFGFFLSFLFIYGMVLRTEGVVDLDRVKSYLNYFSTLHNLALLLRDYEPDFLYTWFLPFNKFLTPFGLANNVEYYDMNHYLTDIYYPHAWEIRATEQWPVEADIYLNFWFLLGLPIVFLYFYMVGFVYSKAVYTRSLGYIVASAMLTLLIVSHLRGSLYNHTDFYLYPFILSYFYIFRRFKV